MKRLLSFFLAACLVLSNAGELRCSPEADKDFLYLEIKRSLRESPSDFRKHFAVGEYLFETGQLEQAAGSFRQAAPGGDPRLDLLSSVYLAEIARLQKDPSAAERVRSLKDALARRRYVSLFGRTRTGRWASPLKNDYEMVERVDRLEVYLNGSLFYVLSLP